ncbi:MAG: LysR family transcriptional regulator [Burkholderiales bacterium]
MENLTDIAVFVKVVESGSFTQTAEQLELSRAVISKYLSRLEERLGVRLLNRTTRRLSLTEAGAALYEASRGALSQIEDAELAISELQKAPRGRLKVNVPVSFGMLHIAPAIPEFLAAFPGISVDMMMEDRIVDLVHEGYDLAIRVSNPTDSTLVARKLAPERLVTCAAPEYLARHGAPETPEDLAGHNCVLYSYGSPVWRYIAPDGKEIAAPVRGNLRMNNGIAQREAALKGLGIVALPTFYLGDYLRQGRLQVLFAEYRTDELGVYAVYPQRKYLSPKVRTFIDFFAQRFGPKPPWFDWGTSDQVPHGRDGGFAPFA